MSNNNRYPLRHHNRHRRHSGHSGQQGPLPQEYQPHLEPSVEELENAEQQLQQQQPQLQPPPLPLEPRIIIAPNNQQSQQQQQQNQSLHGAQGNLDLVEAAIEAAAIPPIDWYHSHHAQQQMPGVIIDGSGEIDERPEDEEGGGNDDDDDDDDDNAVPEPAPPLPQQILQQQLPVEAAVPMAEDDDQQEEAPPLVAMVVQPDVQLQQQQQLFGNDAILEDFEGIEAVEEDDDGEEEDVEGYGEGYEGGGGGNGRIVVENANANDGNIADHAENSRNGGGNENIIEAGPAYVRPPLRPIATLPNAATAITFDSGPDLLNPEQVIGYRVHAVSEGLSKTCSRFKPSADITSYEKNCNQYVTLVLDHPAIVTRLNFDEKLLERMLLVSETDMDGNQIVDHQNGDGPSSSSNDSGGIAGRPFPFYPADYPPPPPLPRHNLNNNLNVHQGGAHQQQPQQAHSRPLPAISFIGGPFRCPESVRASLQSAASVNMFWLVMKSVRFYGGMTEDCPLELTAKYIEEAKVPLVMTTSNSSSGSVPSNVVPETGMRWEDDTRNYGSRIRSSTVLSRTVRQFELSHTIAGRRVACRYIKLVIPSVTSVIASATSYAPHSTSGHLRSHNSASTSSSPSGAYPLPGGGGLTGVASHSEGTFYGPSNAGTIKKQLVFFANAWRLFVTALVNQSRVNRYRLQQPPQYYQQQVVLDPSNNFDPQHQQHQLSGDFMQITGLIDPETVQSAVDFLAKYTYVESLRTALKFFREHNLTAAFDALVRETGVLLEHPSMTVLYKFLVVDGNYGQVERFLKSAFVEEDLFMPYIRKFEVYGGRWTLLSGGCHRMYNTFSVFDDLRPPKVDARKQHQQQQKNGKPEDSKDRPLFPKEPIPRPPKKKPVEEMDKNKVVYSIHNPPPQPPMPNPPPSPCARAGHSMVVDSDEQKVYLFGGLSGREEMNDFWCWDIPTGKWTELARTPNTPCGRTSPGMAIDCKRKRIYMLGRNVDLYNNRAPVDFKSPFYMYDITKEDWTMLSANTVLDGGPGLLLDHQMVLDSERNVLYVIGGLVQSNHSAFVSSDSRLSDLSDFYAYDIEYQEWRLLRFDHQHLAPMKEYINSSSGGNVGLQHQSQLIFDLRSRNQALYDRLYRTFGDLFTERSYYSRTGHSAVFHELQRKMYVLGGHRSKNYLRELLVYDVDKDCLDSWTDFSLQFPREFYSTGYRLRANIDCKKNEIYIFTTLTSNCTNNGPIVPQTGQQLNSPYGSSSRYGQHGNGFEGSVHFNHQYFNFFDPPLHYNPNSSLRGRHTIKNRLWTMDLGYRTLVAAQFHTECCTNSDGSPHQLARIDVDSILLAGGAAGSANGSNGNGGFGGVGGGGRGDGYNYGFNDDHDDMMIDDLMEDFHLGVVEEQGEYYVRPVRIGGGGVNLNPNQNLNIWRPRLPLEGLVRGPVRGPGPAPVANPDPLLVNNLNDLLGNMIPGARVVPAALLNFGGGGDEGVGGIGVAVPGAEPAAGAFLRAGPAYLQQQQQQLQQQQQQLAQLQQQHHQHLQHHNFFPHRVHHPIRQQHQNQGVPGFPPDLGGVHVGPIGGMPRPDSPPDPNPFGDVLGAIGHPNDVIRHMGDGGPPNVNLNPHPNPNPNNPHPGHLYFNPAYDSAFCGVYGGNRNGPGGHHGHRLLWSPTSPTPTSSDDPNSLPDEHPGRTRPRPRFHTNIVYDSRSQTHFLFGGSINSSPSGQLNDFWALKHKRVTPKDIYRICLRLVRRQNYLEMIERGDELRAMVFMRAHLMSCYDKDNPEHKEETQRLVNMLFDDTVKPKSSSKKNDEEKKSSKDKDDGEKLAKNEPQPETSNGSGGDSSGSDGGVAASFAAINFGNSPTNAAAPNSPPTVDAQMPSTSADDVFPADFVSTPLNDIFGFTEAFSNCAGLRDGSGVIGLAQESKASFVDLDRRKLFATLMHYLPPEMTQPKASLSNMVLGSVEK